MLSNHFKIQSPGNMNYRNKATLSDKIASLWNEVIGRKKMQFIFIAAVTPSTRLFYPCWRYL